MSLKLVNLSDISKSESFCLVCICILQTLVIFSEILYKLHTIDEIKEQLDEVDEDIKTLDDQVAYFPIIIISNSTNLNF